GDTALTLQKMHSVLHIHGISDEITPYHASFIEFLHDSSRSGPFYIDERIYRQKLVCCWLHLLH
ncbi:hypothetical protein L218DRAFT_837608, partial [Marasmius fiardii PR-910]